MIEVVRTADVAAESVWAVLADGWAYASWVVGASHIRNVAPDWPAVGSRIHHSVGPWPLTVQDETRVLGVEPGSMLELHARMWPAGAARIHLSLTPKDVSHCEVSMREQVVEGPLKAVPLSAQGAVLRPRNLESLSRLLALATGRATGR